jgi:hypothetical protein
MRLHILAAAVATLGLVACQDDGVEQFGEDVDNTVEETVDGQRDLRDGPAENLGEGLDRAGDDLEQGARDTGNAIEREIDQAREDAKD